MRILYHHRTASRDGQAVHIDEMIAALREQGHEVEVVSPQAAEGEAGAGSMGTDAGWVARLKQALPQAAYELLEFAYSAVAYLKLMRAARRFQPDVIYERYNLFLLAGAMASRRLRVPLLLEVNAPLFEERMKHSGGLSLVRLARWAEGAAWRAADFVLPVTAVLAQHVLQRGVPAQRVVVVPNGINEAHFASAPAPEVAKRQQGLEGALVLGFTGFVRDWHGVDRVIDWMATPAAPTNAFLLVVGDGPVRADLEAQAARLGLAERVRFTGVVHRDAVPAYVAAFDVALQPAVTAYASPLKLMEYLVMAKPVVAPDTPNIREVLENGRNAVLFREGETGAIQAALTQACQDTPLRQHLSREARLTIDRLGLTWRANAQRAVDLARRAAA
ncbi:MAG: glycosyltransferase family 4 protein [Rubrivivax sp.]|jgi:glycosyltransferase involved in cell wall biosynthesis